jgi:hypothetical protein
VTALVVDTNVPVVANGRTPQAGPACVLACIDALDDLRLHNRVVLDSLGRILQEYRNNLSASGQPGVGDAFFKWVWQNQANTTHCETVEIHPRRNGEDYEEFPDDPELARFDRSDRKFVAVALASRLNPPIYNAVDSDWWDFRDALAAHGVTVRFLCPNQFQDRD